MIPLALIGCGLLFLLEAALGLFQPSVYEAVAAASRGRTPPRLRLIGGGMFLWGLLCLSVGVPPREAAQWFLIAAGAAMAFKGTLMMGFPGALKDNPSRIVADPFRWRMKCGLRAAIGLAILLWGLVLGWPWE